MGKIVYFTGGARSGKSSFAEEYTKQIEKCEKIYIATAVPFDHEMKERVKKHREQRGEDWITLEGYKDLDEKLSGVMVTEKRYIILLDCLTNMINNLMFDNEKVDWEKIGQNKVNEIESNIQVEVEKILKFVKNRDVELVVVSNEVGMGIVPEYPLARYFRDIAGRLNQLIAKNSDEAYLAISGIKLKIK